MPVYKTAGFTVVPGGLDRSLDAIRDFVAYVEENEPRTRLYVSLRERGHDLRLAGR